MVSLHCTPPCAALKKVLAQAYEQHGLTFQLGYGEQRAGWQHMLCMNALAIGWPSPPAQGSPHCLSCVCTAAGCAVAPLMPPRGLALMPASRVFLLHCALPLSIPPILAELEFYLLHKPDKQQLLDKQAAMAADAALGRPAGGSIARPPVLPLPLDGHNYSGAAGFEGAAPGRSPGGGWASGGLVEAWAMAPQLPGRFAVPACAAWGLYSLALEQASLFCWFLTLQLSTLVRGAVLSEMVSTLAALGVRVEQLHCESGGLLLLDWVGGRQPSLCGLPAPRARRPPALQGAAQICNNDFSAAHCMPSLADPRCLPLATPTPPHPTPCRPRPV